MARKKKSKLKRFYLLPVIFIGLLVSIYLVSLPQDFRGYTTDVDRSSSLAQVNTTDSTELVYLKENTGRLDLLAGPVGHYDFIVGQKDIILINIIPLISPSPTTWVPSPTTWYPSPTTWYPSPTTWYPSPTTWVPSPTTWYPSPTTWVPSPTSYIPPTLPPILTSTPIPTSTPVPTSTPIPAPPAITFTTALAEVQDSPDMYFKLRVKDDLYFVDNPGSSLATCTDPGASGYDYYIPMRAQLGVYRPVSQINATLPSGATVLPVTADGWILLDNIASYNYYTFILKAPKTRGTKVAEHVFLQSGQNAQHSFDWSGNPLAPGDLINPNKSYLQDCIVNSIDLSLIESRLGSITPADLDIADVNYDGVVNGNDISKAVNTLSTNPEDDI